MDVLRGHPMPYESSGAARYPSGCSLPNHTATRTNSFTPARSEALIHSPPFPALQESRDNLDQANDANADHHPEEQHLALPFLGAEERGK